MKSVTNSWLHYRTRGATNDRRFVLDCVAELLVATDSIEDVIGDLDPASHHTSAGHALRVDCICLQDAAHAISAWLAAFVY